MTVIMTILHPLDVLNISSVRIRVWYNHSIMMEAVEPIYQIKTKICVLEEKEEFASKFILQILCSKILIIAFLEFVSILQTHLIFQSLERLIQQVA